MMFWTSKQTLLHLQPALRPWQSHQWDIRRVACEGRLVAVVPAGDADRAVAALRAHPLGDQAAVIGHVRAEQPGIVQIKTAFGGTRIVDLLVGDPLPRIC